MLQASPTEPTQRVVLLWLSDLARRGGGYELRGVSGWVQPSDVSAAVDRPLATDALARLAAKGQLERHNIALPGRGAPLWLYRINPLGAEVVGAAPPAEPGSAEDSAQLIFTDAQWLALRVMRAAKDEASPLRFTTRERGWRTIGEIRTGALALVRDASIWPEDVYFLVRAGLLEKRKGPGAARARPLVFYRVSEMGENVGRLVQASGEPIGQP